MPNETSSIRTFDFYRIFRIVFLAALFRVTIDFNNEIVAAFLPREFTVDNIEQRLENKNENTQSRSDVRWICLLSNEFPLIECH
jgi:hypothetical protein